MNILKKTLLPVFILMAVTAIAQEKKETAPAKAISWKDVSSWRSISPYNVNISNDGNWVAYPIVMVEGDNELVVKKINDTVIKKYPIGGSSPSYTFSDNGKWLAYKESPKYKETKEAEKNPGKQLFSKLILVELATGKKTEFERVNSYSFNNNLSTHLALTIAKERSSVKPTDPKSADMLLVELHTGKLQNIGNAGEFTFNKAGDVLAYTIDAVNKTGNGLYLLQLKTNTTKVLDNDNAEYKFLNWEEKGNAFALLKIKKDEKFTSGKGTVVGVKNVNTTPVITTYDPANDSLNFPGGYTISSNRRPYWNEDLSMLFFGISPLEPVKKEAAAASGTEKKKDSLTLKDTEKLARLQSDTSIKSIDDLKKALAKMETPAAKAPAKNDADKPDMIIWHWQDKRLQSLQKVQETTEKNFSYLAIYDVTAQKFRQINDSTIKTISVLPKEQYAVAADMSEYELGTNLHGQSYRDIYILNLKNGEKTLFQKKFYSPSFSSLPQASPDGTQLVYGQDGHYYIYNIAKGTSINITANAATSFINTEDDHNVEKPLTPVIGWSSDSKKLLIRNLWDIWQFSADGKEAINLTVTGAINKIRYTGRYQLDQEEKGIDITQPVYVRIYGEKNKKSGIGKLLPGKNGLKPGVEVLVWEDAAVNNLSKAKYAPVYMYSKEKFSTPTEFYAGNGSLNEAAKVTQNAPDYNKYLWSSGVQLVNYVSDKGDSLQGALFLPAGYEKGKKYPTVVYYYEKMSQSLHNYSNPGFPGGGWNPGMYTSNGYAVFMPDIVYKLDDPGMSAVWCVLPGVKAAIQTGVIDENKIGIQGHSWGGYQTAFLVTQTNMFKAAAPGAALTNMVSMYDLIYWNSGGGNMSIFEASQGRFKGAPWENWDSYLRNSPIYYVKNVQTPILLLHNDKDGAVDFTQGIEFYSALRRLQKPVVMITYNGENHGINKLENRKDYAVRMMEFFDHYLKGQPAPDWWNRGIDRLKLPDHLDNRAF